MSKTQPLRIDYDGKWKSLIERKPKAFIEFFLSKIVSQIDFQYPPKLVHQDVAKVVSSPRKKGDLVTDIIMEVNLLDGKKKLLYIHIEVQSHSILAFGEKMFKPFYRLMDKYNQEVTALALFVGDSLPQNYDHYEYQFGDTKVRYEYPTYIVKNQDKATLKASKNPFAIAVLACLYLIETKNKKLYQDRLALKKELANFIVNAAVTQAYDEDTISAIIDFTCNIMVLPHKLEQNFINHCQENFMQKENIDRISGSTIGVANAFSEVFFKQPYSVVLQQIENVKKHQAAKLKAEKEAKEAKLKAEEATKEAKEAKLKAAKEVEEAKLKAAKEAKLKAEKEAKLKIEKLILNLHFKQKLSTPVIALMLEETEFYIQSVITKGKKKIN